MAFHFYLLNCLIFFSGFYTTLHSENVQDAGRKKSYLFQNTLSDTTRGAERLRLWTELSVPKVLFDYREQLAYHYMTTQAYEAAMSEIALLRQEAQRAGYMPGVAASNEAMGVAYLMIGQDSEAAKAFEEGEKMIRLLNDPMYELRINYYLVVCYMRLKDSDKMKRSLERWEILLSNHHEMVELQYNSPWHCLLYTYYVNYYVAVKNREMAKNYLQKATQYFNISYTNRYISAYNLALARYHHLSGEDDLALNYVEKASLVDNSNEPIDVKLAILQGAGRVDEALAAYNSAITQTQGLRVSVYVRQVDQLSALHKLTEKEMQALEMKMQQQKINHQKTLLGAILLFLCLVSILLIVLMRSAWRMKRLKETLQQEQALLQVSSARLTEEKEKAEAANVMKTAFVTNISHDIRIPLNAIVGFSGLLETVEGEEQTEFVRIINSNTARLLELVSDILSLSKLESELFRTNVLSFDINGCCQKAISMIRPHFTPGVKVTVVRLPKPCYVQSDPELVREVLVNLLKYAAGRVTEGEVELRCEQNELAKQLLLSVTEQPPEGQGISRPAEVAEPDNLRLSICRVAAGKVGGQLLFDTLYAKGGHRFVFLLPLNAGEERTDEQPFPSTPNQAS